MLWKNRLRFGIVVFLKDRDIFGCESSTGAVASTEEHYLSRQVPSETLQGTITN
jgi:hypothetical protein